MYFHLLSASIFERCEVRPPWGERRLRRRGLCQRQQRGRGLLRRLVNRSGESFVALTNRRGLALGVAGWLAGCLFHCISGTCRALRPYAIGRTRKGKLAERIDPGLVYIFISPPPPPPFFFVFYWFGWRRFLFFRQVVLSVVPVCLSLFPFGRAAPRASGLAYLATR